MDVTFLGYMNLNFDSNDGHHIEGVKFFYYFPSRKNNYSGFETGGIFVDKTKTDLIDAVKRCAPGMSVHLDMGFDGRRSFFAGIRPVKSA